MVVISQKWWCRNEKNKCNCNCSVIISRKKREEWKQARVDSNRGKESRRKVGEGRA